MKGFFVLCSRHVEQNISNIRSTHTPSGMQALKGVTREHVLGVNKIIFGAYLFSAIFGQVTLGLKFVAAEFLESATAQVEDLMRPKFCFARFSVTVYTGSSSTGRKFDAAEMGFSPGRPRFEWAESLYTYSTWCVHDFFLLAPENMCIS